MLEMDGMEATQKIRVAKPINPRKIFTHFANLVQG